MSSVVPSRRADARARLDIESDFVVADGNVRFRQSFETVKDSETFSIAPAEVVEAARRLLAIDIARELSAIIHDTIGWMLDAAAFPSLQWSPAEEDARCFPSSVCTPAAWRSWTSEPSPTRTSSNGF